ncbi:antA/AntB antirepressor family protein [Aliterella atlantica]|uniref:antA/AntB antirepressor family protein n=1 Tax=Aliterella atlantica TaxID=1827278 RepID=UPI0009081F7D|nr:antA/AntB antirepressor family protein [Aliterella atlantica]
MEFSHELALAIVQSTDEFPIDFDTAWKWIGYSTKQKAKNKLTNNFEQEIDYLTKWVKTPQGGRPSEYISLTLDCFKCLGMMAGTGQGKEVRRYFLECERIAKKAAEIIPVQSARIRELELELQLAQAQAAAAQSQERLMQATNAIAALHGSGLVELVLGKPDAVITRTEVVEKTIAVDAKTGRVKSQSDGLTIGYLTKRLGFKNNEQTWQWLNSVQLGKDSGAWSKELTAHPTLKLPRHLLPQIQRLFAYQVGNRQLLLGEGGGR